MILDFHANTKAFTLTVDRHEADVRDLMATHGLDMSIGTSGLSTPNKAVLFSYEPYAVVAFFNHATDTARSELMAIQETINRSWAISSSRHIDVPADQELSPFQIAGVDYVLSQGNTLIGDQPGLGKTMQAIAVANEMQAERVLVLCPANIRLQWCERIRTWTTLRYPYTVYPILHGRRGVHPTAEWTVISYDLARNEIIWKALAKGKYDLLILDEAHALKTISTKRTRTVFGRHDNIEPIAAALAERSSRILALTGTPLPNRPRECLGSSVKVLTSRGWQPIVKVRKSDMLWDGIEWVGHHGLLFQGCASTVNVAGSIATKTHRFLARNTWVSAGEACQSTAIVNRILEKGSASLPSSGWVLGPVVRCIESIVAAIVAARPEPACNAFVSAAVPAADHAEREKESRRGLQHIRPRALMKSFGHACSRLFWVRFNAAQTPTVNSMSITVAEASASMSLGLKTARLFWRIWFLCLDMKIDLSNLIESITTKATSQEICDGQPVKKTWQIADWFPRFSYASTNLRPVYDLANAGPRQRFTILSKQGPMIVHNCYTLARGLCWDAIDWMSEDRFRDRFNPSEQRETPDGKTYIDERSGRHFELQARLRANFMVRRLKRDVLPQLKIPFLDIVHVEETGAVKQALQAEKLLDIDPENMEGLDMTVRGQVSTVRRMMGLAIAPLAADYIEMLLDGGEEKIVVFAWHIEVLDILMRKLGKYNPLRIDGSTPAMRKPKIVKEFAQNGSRLLIGNILSMGTGTDGLQEACQRGVAAEASWVSGENIQMVDRLDRMGQTHQVLFDFLVAPGSFSEHVLGSSIRKARVTHTALDQRLDDW